MKKRAVNFFVLLVVSVLLVGIVSAGWFDDFFGKKSITGNAIVGGSISTNNGVVSIKDPTLDGNKLHIKPESASKMCELFGYINYTGYAEHDEVYGNIQSTWTITYGLSGSTNSTLVQCSKNGVWNSYDCRYTAKLLRCTPTVSSNTSGSNAYCLDSDGGWNPGVQGSLTQFTGQVNSTQTDFCYNVTHVREYSCERENTNYSISDRISYCSAGCSNGACAVSNLTCTDSDGGVSIYIKGNISLSNGTIINDYCATSSSLIEYSCNSNYVSKFDWSAQSCPNGCSNGACINQTNITYYCTDSDENNIYTKGNVSYGSCTSSGNSGGCSGSLSVDSCISWYDGTSSVYEYLCGNATTPNNRLATNTSRCLNGCVDGSCIVSQPQVCQDLIESVMFPESNSNRQLSWNGSYSDYEYVNGNRENYTQYYASWSWNSDVYDENSINYYYVDISTQVFDNRQVDLSQYALWNNENPACQMSNQWVNGKENYYWICNWDALNNNQDIDNNKDNSRQLLWINDNVIVRMYLYYGLPLSDEEVSRLSQQRVNELISDLKNNDYEYIDWSNFDILYPAVQEVSSALSQCESDLDYISGQGSWSCKTEPAICPEHGYQTKICVRYNYETQKDEVQRQQISCSPGICSGCYVPRWFESDVDNKCIPYGFRFERQVGWKFIEQNYEYSDKEIVTVADSLLYEDFDLIIYQNNSALLRLEALEQGNFVDIYLEEGKTYDWEKLIGYDDENYEHQLTVNTIVYNVTDYNSSYIDLYFASKGSYTQQVADVIPSYCEIDGNVYSQKTIDYNNNWATCQNNYECESNICSSGECIELKAIAQEAIGFKGTVIKFLCRLSNPFSDDGYNQCLAEYLGY